MTTPKTVEELLAAFLAYMHGRVGAGENRPRTVEAYRSTLTAWIATLPYGLAIADLKAFHLVGEGAATWHRVRYAQRLTRWATDMGLIDRDPFLRIRAPHQGGRERIVTRAEMVRLYRGASSRWFRRFLFLMRHTGARPGELRAARWDDVDLEARVICLADFKAKRRRRDGVRLRTIVLDGPTVTLLRGMRRNPRPSPLDLQERRRRAVEACLAGCRTRDVAGAIGITVQTLSEWVRLDTAIAGDVVRLPRGPLPQGLAPPALPDWLCQVSVAGPEDFVFRGRFGEPITNNALRCAMRVTRRRAGLADLDDNGERIVCYSLRHTAATELTAAGMSDRALADMMGHTTTKTTAKYQHLNQRALVEALDRARRAQRSQ